MWELGHKEGWELQNRCFQTVVLEKTLGSPLESKEIKPVNPKGNQPWMFIGRTDAEAEYFGHLIQGADSLEMTLMLGKIEGQRRKVQQDWMVGWPRRAQCTWMWANSGRQRRMGKPGVLQSVGLKRVRHDLGTELQRQHFKYWNFSKSTLNN